MTHSPKSHAFHTAEAAYLAGLLIEIGHELGSLSEAVQGPEFERIRELSEAVYEFALRRSESLVSLAR